MIEVDASKEELAEIEKRWQKYQSDFDGARNLTAIEAVEEYIDNVAGSKDRPLTKQEFEHILFD